MMMRIRHVGVIAFLAEKRLPQEKSGTRFSKIRSTPQTKKSKKGQSLVLFANDFKGLPNRTAVAACGVNLSVAMTKIGT